MNKKQIIGLTAILTTCLLFAIALAMVGYLSLERPTLLAVISLILVSGLTTLVCQILILVPILNSKQNIVC